MIFPAQVKEQVRAIFSDFDDTLTHDSLFNSKTLQTLEKLKQKGFWLVVVSGRPAGWADCNVEVVLPEGGLTMKELNRLVMFLYPYCKDVELAAPTWTNLPH